MEHAVNRRRSRAPGLCASVLVSLVVVAALLSSCGPHRKSWVHPAYEEEDQRAILRLGVITSPLPLQDPRLGELWTTLARQYANQHRDFIVRGLPLEEDTEVLSHCGSGLEGILHVEPLRVERKGGGYALAAVARILRCRDGGTIWEAVVRGRFDSEDPHLIEVRRRYVDALGDDALGPLVAPSFRLTRALLSSLPTPQLTRDADIMEKIELGE